MLSKEDNELLTQIDPSTPMGNLIRRYWVPALLSEEVPKRTARPSACGCWAKSWSPFATAEAHWLAR